MFTFPLNPSDLFNERSRQFQSWGIPRSTIKEVQYAIQDMWREAPGGWTHEWFQRGKQAEQQGKMLRAAACYGAARFPSACTAFRQNAYDKQLECYLKAAPRFPCQFERRVIPVHYRSEAIDVPVHIFTPRNGNINTQVLLSGGVDTWKMELHRLALALCRFGGFRTVAIDMPGTGESTVPLAPDGDVIYRGVIEAFSEEAGQGSKFGFLGISFGGHWAVKLALTAAIHASVDIGGPVGARDRTAEEFSNLPHGMVGIIGNAMGLSEIPSTDDMEEILASFSLKKQGLLERDTAASLLVINGDADPYVPPEDTTVFAGRANADVWLVPGGYHCVANQFLRIMPGAIAWLRCKLWEETNFNLALYAVTRAIRPPLTRL